MSDPLFNTKVNYADDSRQRHQGTLTIKDEDHTLGNVIRYQLLQDSRVRFAGYKKPHPLEEVIEIKVQTNGELSPPDSVINACNKLKDQMGKLKTSLESQVILFRGTVDQMIMM